MKRYIHLTGFLVLAMAMTACVREQFESPNSLALGEEDFAFSLGTVTTKALTQEDGPTRSIKLGDSGYFLEESVESLDAPSFNTKGTPIYTENINNYYETINVVGYKVGGIEPYVPDTGFGFTAANESGKKVYSRRFVPSFWPGLDDDDPLWFFLRAPQANLDTYASNISYNTTANGGSIEFDYQSPLVGSNQADILFTSRTLTKKQYYDAPNYHGQGGAPVTLNHALTAVRFRSGHANTNTTHTIIKKVEFIGLKSTGHCTITPDDTKESRQNVTWDTSDGVTGLPFEQEFRNPKYFDEDEETGEVTVSSDDGTYNYTANDGFGSSWTSAAASKNLNDEAGTMTFWFIPQTLTTNVILKVTFCVKTPDTPNGTDITHTIRFGDLLARSQSEDEETGVITYSDFPEWKAGELRTYTLMPLDVDVDIFDKMEVWTKSDLHVTNTGNVDEYVRMMLVGNWYDGEGNILVGYKYSGPDDENLPEGGNPDEMVVPWYREADEYSGGFDDSFAGGKPSGDNKWIFGTGSYFYYPEVIGAGDKLAQTTALFQSYTLDDIDIPDIYIPSTTSNVRVKAQGVHLVMEVVIQAISAINPETGEPFETEDGDGWKAAWSYATGKTIDVKD